MMAAKEEIAKGIKGISKILTDDTLQYPSWGALILSKYFIPASVFKETDVVEYQHGRKSFVSHSARFVSKEESLISFQKREQWRDGLGREAQRPAGGSALTKSLASGLQGPSLTVRETYGIVRDGERRGREAGVRGKGSPPPPPTPPKGMRSYSRSKPGALEGLDATSGSAVKAKKARRPLEMLDKRDLVH